MYEPLILFNYCRVKMYISYDLLKILKFTYKIAYSISGGAKQ